MVDPTVAGVGISRLSFWGEEEATFAVDVTFDTTKFKLVLAALRYVSISLDCIHNDDSSTKAKMGSCPHVHLNLGNNC